MSSTPIVGGVGGINPAPRRPKKKANAATGPDSAQSTCALLVICSLLLKLVNQRRNAALQVS
jgi:hypothetical protein